jgi:hypothetical protein
MMKDKIITVVFTVDTYLPRFTMRIGETWSFRESKLTAEGFTCGNGFVPASNFEVVKS